MRHHAIGLYEYHMWANEKMFLHLKELPQEILHQEIQSVFPSVFAVLAHMYVVENAWLCGMSGLSRDEMMARVGEATEKTTGKSVEEMEKLFHELYVQYKALLSKQDLDATRVYSHPHYGSMEATYTDILQHVVNHGTYHRGNLSAMLHQLGYSGTATDYVHYLYYLNQQK